MRILGIDPGTLSLGYGIVEEDEEKITMVHCGALTLSPRLPIAQRLSSIYERLQQMITDYRPDEVAIEEPFLAQNVRSALAIGRAEAVAILAAANSKLPLYYYSPAEIKRQVTNYGASNKEQVQEMVRIQLGLSQPPQPNDAADAPAVAICHLCHLRSLSIQSL